MLDFLKSARFFALFWLVTVYYATILLAKRVAYALVGKELSGDLVHETATNWAHALFHLTPGWSIEIKGQENLPEKPYVFVVNHESSTDILAVYLLQAQFRWLAKDSIFKMPIIGWAMNKAGYVKIKRGDKNSHKEALEQSRSHLKANTPMLFFPEGSRSTSGRPGKFKIGAFKLSVEEGVPVVPIVLLGGGALMKKRTLCPKKQTMHVHILAPERAKEGESVVEYTARIEALFQKYHKEMVESLT